MGHRRWRWSHPAPGDKADARFAGQLAVGIRHHGRAAFLPADAEGDLRHVIERIQNSEITFAGNAESRVDAVQPQLIDQNATACTQIILRCHVGFLS